MNCGWLEDKQSGMFEVLSGFSVVYGLINTGFLLVWLH